MTEWKSDWRIEFERRSAEERARRPHKPPCPKAAPKVKRPRQPPKPRAHKQKRFCACGNRVRKLTESQCFPCRDKAPRPPCKWQGCSQALYRNNHTGYCKRHWNTLRKHRPRQVCQYQAEGMRCAQELYRNNPTGFCCFHNGRELHSKYRGRSPKMVPLESPAPRRSLPRS